MLKDYLPPVCVHCGKIENVLDDTNPCTLLFMDNFLLWDQFMKVTDAKTGKILCPKDAEDRQYNYDIADVFWSICTIQ